MSQDEDMFYDNQLELKMFTVLTDIRPGPIEDEAIEALFERE